jgi:hypothetical protein
MSEINNVMITYVRKCFTAIDISNFLFENRIAEVSRITLAPVDHLSFHIKGEFNVAYITIDKWLSKSSSTVEKLRYQNGEYFDLQNKDTWHLKINNEIKSNMVDYVGQATIFLPRPAIFYEDL